MADRLAPFFLGAYGENNDFFEKTLVELLRDHLYWRRNFHPEDRPSISTVEQYERDYLEGMARARRELHQLTAQLKRSVPFFHPRYIGHMASELLMPGVIAHMVTTLYNPNNIVEEAAPITVALELKVGQQLSRMVGYVVDPSAPVCALGHLTSGGTLANDEALWVARAVKLYPLAARAACAELNTWPDPLLREADDWALLNQSTPRVLELAAAIAAHPEAGPLQRAIERHRVETLGLAQFCARHPLVAHLSVLAPSTAHYSWEKAMKLLGLGAAQLLEVPTTEARVDVGAFEQVLEREAKHHRPVLAVVGVYGSTEFGSVDPLDALVARRGRPLEYWLHVDAAWGGYLPSAFRDEAGALRPRDDIRKDFRHFPSERVYRATEAMSACDSVTIDPHKLGFVPFGAGAFLVRDRRALDLVQQDASYVFSPDPGHDDARYRKLGRFILEGSKPGAAAAACYVNHQVLPLHAQHFGRIVARSVQSAELLFERLQALSTSLEPLGRLAVPFTPETNLVCFAFNPASNRSLAAANAFGQRMSKALAPRGDEPVQFRQFFGSSTMVALSHWGADERARMAKLLGVNLDQPDDQGVFFIRHTLMNPWLQTSPSEGAPTYLDAYTQHLSQLIRELCKRPT